MNRLALLASPAGAAWLDARDPRLRVIAAALFALVTVNLNRPAPLLVALGAGMALAVTAGLDPRRLVWRLIAVEAFMLVVLLSLPFTVPGEAIFQAGPLSASREGLTRAVTIMLKANAVVLVLLALVGTLDPTVLGHALARLRVPDKLVHLFLLSVRYIDVLHREYSRLRLAMRARAFTARSDRHTWRTLGWLTGMLLVRSLERSRRVVDAMKCRGFDGRFYLLDERAWRAADNVWALGTGLALGGLLVLEHLG